MADTLKFELVSPEQLLISADAEIVSIPGTEGDMGVLANHAPVMTTLRPGLVVAKMADGSEQKFFVAGGFADVTPALLTILAEFGIPLDELTREIYDERKRLAQEAYDRVGDDVQKKAAAYFYLEQFNHLEPTILPD